jgi:hypothetical protein
VLVKGKAIESDGNEHPLVKEVPLGDLLPFFKRRITWPQAVRHS